MARKTWPVADIKGRANNLLARPGLSQDEKRAIFVFTEAILQDAGQYHGFNWIAWLNGGVDQWRQDGKPSDVAPYLGNEYDRFFY